MTLPAPPKLLTIDLDDTLWPCEPPIRLAEARLADWLAEAAPRLALAHDQASLRWHRMGLMRDRPDLAHDPTFRALDQTIAEIESADFSEVPIIRLRTSTIHHTALCRL